MRLPHMRYADLRRRLHTAYCYDSMGENPEEYGDPRIEDKLAEALQRYTEDQFGMLMEHMQWDLQLHPEGYREFVEYAIRLRFKEARCDSITPWSMPSTLGPIVTGHKV